MLKHRLISLEQARRAIASYEQTTFRYTDVDLEQSLELSQQLNIYACDAYVLACALNLRLPLLTLDGVYLMRQHCFLTLEIER